MKFKDILKKIGPYVLAAALFVAAALIYCSPQLSGKVLYAGDIESYKGASQEAREYWEKNGEITYWTGSMFSGMPTYQIMAKYKADDLMAPLQRTFSHRDNPALMLILYLVCFFIMLRAFGVDKWMSIAGAFAIALSSYFLVIIPAGHFTKVTSIALCAVIIGGFGLIFRKKYILGAILTMVFTAIAFKPHPQMFYYFMMLIGVLWIANAVDRIKSRNFKELGIATAIFALSVAIGMGTGMSNVFTNSEYSSQTMRGGQTDLVQEGAAAEVSKGLDLEYATQWSYGIDETMSLMIPGFKGGANAINVGKHSKLYKGLIAKKIPVKVASNYCAAAPMYWGDQPFTSGNVYVGAIICFLFLLGLLIVKGPYKWGLLAATLFSIALSWGHNWMGLTEFFFKYFPMYSKFRAVSSILVVAEVAMPLLGFLAIKEIFEGNIEKKKLLRSVYISGGVTAGICLFFALFGGSLFTFTCAGDASIMSSNPDWLYGLVCEQREIILRTDSLRSALFIIAAAATIWLYLNDKLKKAFLPIILGALIILDMWPVDRRYFNDSYYVRKDNSKEEHFPMADYEKAILQDPGYFRVMNLTTSTFNDARTSYYLKSIGGYSAVKLRRYNDLIEQHLSKMNVRVIGMLNGKYLIVNGDDGQPEIMQNPYALGNAWFVDKLTVVDDANAESEALNSIDPRYEAVLDKEFAQYAANPNPAVPEDARIVLTKYEPNALDYTYSTSQPGTIVFSEIYYPFGWKASIDGAPVDHYRVDYTLRAMNVPAGTHNIQFIFDPDSVKKGDGIAIFFIILMYLAVLCGIGYGIKKCFRS